MTNLDPDHPSSHTVESLSNHYGNCPLCGKWCRIITDLDGQKYYSHDFHTVVDAESSEKP